MGYEVNKHLSCKYLRCYLDMVISGNFKGTRMRTGFTVKTMTKKKMLRIAK